MSIDINWETLTGGHDGEALAESIRAFIHDRFQTVTLPRMIRSVKVHSFDFGTIPPTVELKDICDPLPDFYEGDDDDGNDDEDDQDMNQQTADLGQTGGNEPKPTLNASKEPQKRTGTDNGSAESNHPNSRMPPLFLSLRTQGVHGVSFHNDQTASAIISRSATPGILGGTSNLGYFHLPLSAGLSGTSTPLAAVAGAQFQNSWPDSVSTMSQSHHRSTSFGSVTPPSTASRPTSSHQDWPGSQHEHSLPDTDGQNSPPFSTHSAEREKSADDIQIVSHITYSGNIRLSLTAEILLDYPMPSFVGIPLQLNITGLTFDGVAILAYIKKKAHFCFLSPEDADSLIGNDVDLRMSEDQAEQPTTHDQQQRHKVGGLLEEIKVESEIGQKDSGKQVLKNVGKVEKFILEQVRRIFEDEFVYPSFWTFLV